MYRMPSRRYSKKVPKNIRAYVKTAIHSSLENKKTNALAELIPFSDTISTASFNSLVPAVLQGTAQSNRVGNRIRIKKATLRLFVHVYEQSVTIAPVYVDVYIIKNKNSNGTLGPIATDFLQFGATAIQYNGGSTPYCGLLDVNSDQYALKYKKRLLMFNPPSGLTTAYTAALNPTASWSIDCTRMFKTHQLYNDTTSVPSNDNLWLAIGTTQSDGVNMAVNTGEVTYVMEFEYEDA